MLSEHVLPTFFSLAGVVEFQMVHIVIMSVHARVHFDSHSTDKNKEQKNYQSCRVFYFIDSTKTKEQFPIDPL